MFKTIMTALDVERPENCAAPLEKAAHLARREEARLHLVSVRADDSGLTATEFRDAVAAFAAMQGKRLGLEIPWRAFSDDEVDEGLARAVEELEPDLVVLGAHEPRWLEWFTGPVLRDFVAECETSLLIAR